MSQTDRRNFLIRSGLAVGAGLLLPSLKLSAKPYNPADWNSVRAQFKLAPDRINMALMLLASHPKSVTDAIEKHRASFDDDPVTYWEDNWVSQQQNVKEAAARYMNCNAEEIALTDSTTMGLGILYGGLKLKQDDEIVTTTHDHYSTEKSLDFAAQKSGAVLKRTTLYDDPAKITIDEVTSKLQKAITAKTRIVAVTWVHSCTGVKLPLHEMSEVIKKVNTGRDAKNRIYFCVDGVHGFGIDAIDINHLGCDFFSAGTHKWLFGPRGTGILYARKDAWDMLNPTIPAFSYNSYGHWLGLVPESNITFSDMISPGGFHSFEHRWALPEAFKFHMDIGKEKVEKRTRHLNTMLKNGLSSIRHVKLYTPHSPDLSAGINCFEVDGIAVEDVVKKLHGKHIIASSSPYRISYARLTPCIVNTEDEVKTCIKALEDIKV